MDKKILNKYIEGDASQAEKETVQLWIESDINNRKELMALRTLYDITLAHSQEASKKGGVSQKTQKQRLLVEIMKIAAAVLITFGFTYYLLQEKPVLATVHEVSMQTLYIPAGQRAELTLGDGSKVWLNSLTTFTFPTDFVGNSRDVYLDGEGYFEIVHDENKQFNVNTKEYVVKVLGTEFNLLAYSKNRTFETSLIGGSVEIESNDGSENVLLTSNQKAFLKNDRLATATIQHHDYFLWREGIISLNHERMEDVLKKMEVYYDVKIENRNKRILDIRYTGKFRTKDGIEHVLKVLQVAAGFKFKKDSEKNLIQIY